MAIRFAVEGDLRFVSHRDSVRLFERALIRARIPVRYSSGFNPRARLWIPLPRPVGVVARDELMIVELSEPRTPEWVVEALGAELPDGLSLYGAERIETRSTPRAVAAEYRLPLTNGFRQALGDRAKALVACDRLDVDRGEPGVAVTKTLNIRPFIEALEVVGDELTARVHLTPGGSVRPRELLEALGLVPDDHLHRLRRTAVTWEWPSRTAHGHSEIDEGAAS